VKSRFLPSVDLPSCPILQSASPLPEQSDSTSITSAACTIDIPNTASILSHSNPIPKQNQEEEKRYTLPKQQRPRFAPFTAPWVVERLKDQPEERAIPILRVWAHPKRHMEINRQTIDVINKLNDGEAVDAIEELKDPQVFI
jgi:hypothetical protein